MEKKTSVACLDDLVLCFMVFMASAFGQEVSEGHDSSHVSPLADFPASCFIVPWVKNLVSSSTENIYLTHCLLFCSDVLQVMLATHCLDRDVLLAMVMKSTVRTRISRNLHLIEQKQRFGF